MYFTSTICTCSKIGTNENYEIGSRPLMRVGVISLVAEPRPNIHSSIVINATRGHSIFDNALIWGTSQANRRNSGLPSRECNNDGSANCRGKENEHIESADPQRANRFSISVEHLNALSQAPKCIQSSAKNANSESRIACL